MVTCNASNTFHSAAKALDSRSPVESENPSYSGRDVQNEHKIKGFEKKMVEQNTRSIGQRRATPTTGCHAGSNVLNSSKRCRCSRRFYVIGDYYSTVIVTFQKSILLRPLKVRDSTHFSQFQVSVPAASPSEKLLKPGPYVDRICCLVVLRVTSGERLRVSLP